MAVSRTLYCVIEQRPFSQFTVYGPFRREGSALKKIVELRADNNPYNAYHLKPLRK